MEAGSKQPQQPDPKPAAKDAAAKALRRHRGLVYGLIVLASIVGFLAVFSIWAKRQALETDNWVDTSTKLLEDEEIRTQLADYMTETLYANVNVQGELEKALPKDLKPLSGPASAGLRQLTTNLANRALEQPKVQEAWEALNRTAHETLIKVIEDNADEPVTIDLGSIVADVGEQVGIDAADKIPEGAAELTILPADKLSSAQKIVNIVQKLAIFLVLASIALFALAIYLAQGWRREALRATGFGFILIGLAVIVVRNLAGDYITDQLAATASVQPAVQDAWSISTSLLDAGGGAMIVYGVFIVIAAWLAAPGPVATAVRRAMTPIMEQRAIGYGALALFLLMLFWWSPTEGFHRLAPALLIIALLVIGFEFLRHKAIREFPDETWETGTARWRETGRSLMDRVGKTDN